MATVYVTRIMHFNAAHRLHTDVLTEAAGPPVAGATRQRIVDALRRQAAADGADAL